MEIHPPQKLYTFIDESGQDTRGAFFVVATVLTAENHERVRQSLERLERASGKGRRKWMKATPRQRLAYLTAVLQLPALHGRLFAAHFTETTTYLPCILTTVTAAVTAGAAGRPARATVLIDGLQAGHDSGQCHKVRTNTPHANRFCREFYSYAISDMLSFWNPD